MATTLKDYSNASFVEVFFDYCTSGIDFSLPGNGGPECRDVISWQKRITEDVLVTLVGLTCLIMGWRNHKPPPSPGATAPAPYEYSPSRIVLLILLTFTWALEVCYKLATRQTVFVINPCHMICVMQLMLLALPNNSVFNTYLFRFHLYFLHGPWMAVVFPVTNTLFMPFEYSTYWLEHALLVFIPFYLLRQGGYFTVDPFMNWKWPLMTYGAWLLYHGLILEPLGIFSLGNLNCMLCPAISDPFYGPNWRLHALWHQFILNVAAGKLYSLVGKQEAKEENLPNGLGTVGRNASTEDRKSV